jgi:hypothetical protein
MRVLGCAHVSDVTICVYTEPNMSSHGRLRHPPNNASDPSLWCPFLLLCNLFLLLLSAT